MQTFTWDLQDRHVFEMIYPNIKMILLFTCLYVFPNLVVILFSFCSNYELCMNFFPLQNKYSNNTAWPQVPYCFFKKLLSRRNICFKISFIKLIHCHFIDQAEFWKTTVLDSRLRACVFKCELLNGWSLKSWIFQAKLSTLHDPTGIFDFYRF